jgi:hypothetical protein
MRWAVLGPTPGKARKASMSCVRRTECFISAQRARSEQAALGASISQGGSFLKRQFHPRR